MSDKEKEGDEKAEASKVIGVSKKTLILVVAGVLAFFVIGGGAAFYFIQSMHTASSKSEHSEEVSAAEHGEAQTEEHGEASPSIIYIDIRPEFVVNFNGKDRQHFLQLNVTFSTRDSSISEKMRAHMPLIRNSMVMLFGGKSYEEMKSAEGKNLLRKQLLESVQALLKKEINTTGVEEVYFTTFVMQ